MVSILNIWTVVLIGVVICLWAVWGFFMMGTLIPRENKSTFLDNNWAFGAFVLICGPLVWALTLRMILRAKSLKIPWMRR